MKKCFTILLLAAMLCTLSACGQRNTAPTVVGGWTITDSVKLTEKAQDAFDKAMDGLVGVSYTPLALLATQPVSGTNYCLLCEARVVYPDAAPYYALVYLYQDLQGSAAITNLVALDIGKIAESGQIENTAPAGGSLLGGWTVDRDSEIKTDKAVMHLATQTVSGKNHCVLCHGYELRFLYEDLGGKTELKQSVPLDIAALSVPVEVPEESPAAIPTAEEFVQEYFQVVGAYHPGTAGSSLRRAQAACGAVRFAAEHAIQNTDIEALRAGMLAAWESMSDQERTDFDANFLDIIRLIDSCRSDWETERGAFEDAGVGEEMAALLRDEAALEAWSVLSAHTLTMGNSEG